MICFVEPDDIKKAWQYWIYIGLHSSYIVTPQRSLICINALLNSYLSTIFQHLWYKRFPNNRIQVIFSLGPKHSYIWTSWRRMMYGTGKKNMCVLHSAKSITENTHMEQWCIEGFCEICCVQSTWGHRATLKFFGTDGVNYCKQQLFTFTKIQTGKIIQSFFFSWTVLSSDPLSVFLAKLTRTCFFQFSPTITWTAFWDWMSTMSTRSKVGCVT